MNSLMPSVVQLTDCGLFMCPIGTRLLGDERRVAVDVEDDSL